MQSPAEAVDVALAVRGSCDVGFHVKAPEIDLARQKYY